MDSSQLHLRFGLKVRTSSTVPDMDKVRLSFMLSTLRGSQTTYKEEGYFIAVFEFSAQLVVAVDIPPNI
jgi:hypothetical protein